MWKHCTHVLRLLQNSFQCEMHVRYTFLALARLAEGCFGTEQLLVQAQMHNVDMKHNHAKSRNVRGLSMTKLKTKKATKQVS